jgi:hypothetical protein
MGKELAHGDRRLAVLRGLLDHRLMARREMLLTPHFSTAFRALSERNRYCTLPCSSVTRKPAASISDLYAST